MTLEPNTPTAAPRLRKIGNYLTIGGISAVLLFVGWILFVQYRVQSQGLAL